MNSQIKIMSVFVLVMIIISCKKEHIQPTKLNVEGGEEVLFESPRNYNNSAYHWEFGDGLTSNEKSPTHIYKNAGTFVVTLTITKNGKVKNKFNPFLVKVEQLYVPRIDSLRLEPYDQDYLYAGEQNHLGFYVSDEIDNDDSYSYEIYVDGNLVSESKVTTHTFPDSGHYDISLKLYDKNNVSGTLDTTVYIGSDQTFMNFNVPNANLGPLGTVTEEYIIIYRNYSFEWQNDYNDFLDYPGPTSNLLINNGELMSYYGPNPGDYFYFSFDPLGYASLSGVVNGTDISIDVPAFDWPTDFDDLKYYLLIVGTNGINIAEGEVQITPGTVLPSITLPTPTFFPY